MKNILPPLFFALTLQTSFAITVFTIDEMTVNDSGNPGDVTIQAGSTTSVITTQGDLNLVGFSVGGTNYNSSDFISGIGTNSVIDSNDVAGVIQPSNATADGSLYTGSPSNLTDYLIQGERGLSFSSALNYATTDNPNTFEFDISFLSDPTASSLPTFIVGDGADNQSADLWSFLDAVGNTLFSITLDPSNFSTFGDQVVDRVFSDNSGFRPSFPGDTSNDTPRGLGMAAFSLTAADLGGANWQDVARLSVRVPGTGDEPKTDYAFFGVDATLIEGNLVVPEPSSMSLLMLGGILLFSRRVKPH